MRRGNNPFLFIMKFNIKDSRELIPQLIRESDKAYKQRVSRDYITSIILSLTEIRDFSEFDVVWEYNNRKKLKNRVIIDFKSKWTGENT